MERQRNAVGPDHDFETDRAPLFGRTDLTFVLNQDTMRRAEIIPELEEREFAIPEQRNDIELPTWEQHRCVGTIDADAIGPCSAHSR